MKIPLIVPNFFRDFFVIIWLMGLLPASSGGEVHLVPATNCAQRFSSAPEPIWKIGAEFSEIRMGDKTLSGRWYFLGRLNSDTLLFVEHGRNRYLHLRAGDLSGLDLDSVPTLPRIFSQGNDPTCLAAALKNALCDLKMEVSEAESKRIDWELYFENPAMKPIEQDAKLRSLFSRRGLPVTHHSQIQNKAGLVAHLRNGGTAIVGYTGDDYERTEHQVATRDEGALPYTFRSVPHTRWKWTGHSNQDPEKTPEGHAVFVKGELPDGRFLVADGGRFTVASLHEITGRESWELIRIHPLSTEVLMEEKLFPGPEFPAVGSYLKGRLSDWSQNELEEVEGWVIQANPEAPSGTGSLEYYDIYRQAIRRLEGPFNRGFFNFKQPLVIDSSAPWKTIKAPKQSIDPLWDIGKDPVNAVIQLPFGPKKSLFKVGELLRKESGLFFKTEFQRDFKPFSLSREVGLYQIPKNSRASLSDLNGEVAEHLQGVTH